MGVIALWAAGGACSVVGLVLAVVSLVQRRREAAHTALADQLIAKAAAVPRFDKPDHAVMHAVGTRRWQQAQAAQAAVQDKVVQPKKRRARKPAAKPKALRAVR